MNNTTEGNSTHRNFDDIEGFLSFLIPFGLVILSINAIALRVFLNGRFQSKKSTHLLVNLTTADSLVGLTIVLLCICSLNLINGNAGIEALRILRGLFFLLQLFLIASLFSPSAIAVERWVAIMFPFKHRLASARHYYAAISVVWTFALLTPVLNLLKMEKIISDNGFLVFIYLTGSLGLAIIALCYLCIWIKVTFFPEVNMQCRTVKENKTLTKTLFIITAISMVTWSPKGIKDLFRYDEVQRQQVTITSLLFQLLLLSNSVLNVIIYAFRMPDFRRELKKVFPLGQNH